MSEKNVKLIAEKWYKKLDFPKEYDKTFYELLSSENGFTEMQFTDFDLEKNADEHRRNVIWALYFCEEVSEKYKEKNIPEEIMMDTLLDVRFHILKYSTPHEFRFVGLSIWIFLHLSFKLFKVGRLQYELRGAMGGAEHLGLPEGEPVLAVHIPKGEALTEESVIESFDLANKFFEKYFPEYQYRYFTCFSWLLDRNLEKILKDGSNILKFGRLFNYAFDVKKDDAIEFTFPLGTTRENIKNAEAKSSLHRNLKEYVLSGGELNITFGIRDKNE